jgi:hypothetical protein
MDAGTQVAVWLRDEGAREFLGAPAASRASRWVARGRVTSVESPIGFWLSVDSVQEWKVDGRKTDWIATAPLCLMRWDVVITVQALAEGTADIGFVLKAPGVPVATG